MKHTRVCDLLGIEYPIIQAPMVWITGADLAAAVSNAGGLGTIGMNAGAKDVTTDVIETGERLRNQIRKAKQLTDRPFAVNIAVPEMPFSDRCVEVALQEGVAVALLIGDSPNSYTQRFKKAGVKVLWRPLLDATVASARRAEAAGVDAVIVTGYEAGGHGGTDQLPTLVLVPQVVDAVSVPVIGGGGISDGRGAAAVLALGAEGVFIGTAFMATHECDAHPRVKQAVVDATETSTVAWTSRLGSVRALRNHFTDQVMKMKQEGASDREIAKFCYGADKFRPGLVNGDVDEFFIPMGAGAGMITRVISAGDLVRDIASGASACCIR